MAGSDCFFCGHTHTDPGGRYCSRCGEFYDLSLRKVESHYGGALFNSIIFMTLTLGFAFLIILMSDTSRGAGPVLWFAAMIGAPALLPIGYAAYILRLRAPSRVSRSRANTQSACIGILAAALAAFFFYLLHHA